MAMKDKLADAAYAGMWALFFVAIAAIALLILSKADRLPGLVENVQDDSYDTILSARFFSEYGPFGNIPLYTGPYALFGNFPLLYSMLASILNLAIGDMSLSATLLYWAVEIGIAALLWGGILRKCDWRIRTAFVALFLVDAAFGNFFPLGYRKRQQLAILLGLAMFAIENRYSQGVLGFAAMLAQPFTGAALIFIKGADSLQRKDWRAVAILAAALAASYPFYSTLLSATSQEPSMPGCGLITSPNYAGLGFLLSLAFLAFFITNWPRRDALYCASAALVLFLPLALTAYLLIKDLAPAGFSRWFLNNASMPCNESLLQVSAVGVAVLIGLRGFQVPRATILLILAATIISLSILATMIIAEQSIKPAYSGWLTRFDDMGLSQVKTMKVVMTNYSGRMESVPFFTFFPLQSYALLHGANVTFVDEYNLPPQISRGASNVPMSKLPLAIYEGDVPACRLASSQIRDSGAEALLFLVDFDFTSRSGAELGRFENSSILSGCGLELASATTLSDSSVMLLYRVVQS